MKNVKYFFEWIFYLIILVFLTVMIIIPVTLFIDKDTPPAIPAISIDTQDISSAVNEIISATEPETTEPPIPKKHLIDNFEVIWQLPELPTGCEITAFTMVLNYYGYKVSKEAMGIRFLPRTDAEFHRDKKGKLIGPDLNKYFVGDPSTDTGYICGTQAIITAVERYFHSIKSDSKVIDMTGSEPSDLYRLVSKDTPVTVWVTIEMKDRTEPEGWYTKNGDYVDWCTLDHGAVLIGYDENTVTIADPLSGIITYEKKQFESVFKSRGNRCLIINQ